MVNASKITHTNRPKITGTRPSSMQFKKIHTLLLWLNEQISEMTAWNVTHSVQWTQHWIAGLRYGKEKKNISRKQHDQESSVSSRNTNYNGRYIIIQTHRWPSEMTASSNELLLITYGYKSSTAEQSKASQSRPLNSIMDIVLAGTLLSIQSRHSYNRQWWHTGNKDMRFCTIKALRNKRAMITR
jgi:hypothetical protein